MSHPQQYLFGNLSEFIAYEHCLIWICKVTSNKLYQINVVERMYKVVGHINYQAKYLETVLKYSTWVNLYFGLFHHWLSEVWHWDCSFTYLLYYKWMWFLITCIGISPEKAISVDPSFVGCSICLRWVCRNVEWRLLPHLLFPSSILFIFAMRLHCWGFTCQRDIILLRSA